MESTSLFFKHASLLVFRQAIDLTGKPLFCSFRMLLCWFLRHAIGWIGKPFLALRVAICFSRVGSHGRFRLALEPTIADTSKTYKKRSLGNDCCRSACFHVCFQKVVLRDAISLHPWSSVFHQTCACVRVFHQFNVFNCRSSRSIVIFVDLFCCRSLFPEQLGTRWNRLRT